MSWSNWSGPTTPSGKKGAGAKKGKGKDDGDSKTAALIGIATNMAVDGALGAYRGLPGGPATTLAGLFAGAAFGALKGTLKQTPAYDAFVDSLLETLNQTANDVSQRKYDSRWSGYDSKNYKQTR